MKIGSTSQKLQMLNFLKLTGMSAGLLLGVLSELNGCLFANTQRFLYSRYPQQKPTIEASLKLVSFSSLAYVGLLLISVRENSSARCSSQKNSS